MEIKQRMWEFGYRGQRPERLAEWLEEHPKTVLVDVRYGIMPPFVIWSQNALKKRLGLKRYEHMRELGNVNYKNGGKTELADPEVGLRGLKILFDQGLEPVLLCACASFDDCHRRDVTALVLERWPNTEVLTACE